MSDANAVATRLPEFAQHEPLTWFRRAETRFRLRGIKQATTRADYVLEALPETIFRRIGPWLDQQPDEIPYDDLKKHLLKEFSPTTSERARRLFLMPSQPIGDRKPSQLWDEICMLSRLPETDEDSKNKEVDLKKEIWLQTLPSCVRVLLHNTDEKSMDDLSTLADEIMMSQNAACHDTSRCLPPDVIYVRRTPDVTPVRRTPDVTPVRRTPDVTPVRRTPDVTPVRRTPDVRPVRRTPDVTPVRRTPDVMPRPAETTDDVVPVQRANWYANHNQFHATLESNGLCSYHNKFGNRARKCISGCRWFSKNFTSGRF